MISIPKFTKGHNSIKNVGRVMIFNLCTSSDGTLYLYQHMRISQTVSELLSRYKIITDRQRD